MRSNALVECLRAEDLACAPQDTEREGPVRASRPEAARKKVLIVDDDDSFTPAIPRETTR